MSAATAQPPARVDRRTATETQPRRRGDRIALGRLRAAIAAVATVEREERLKLEARIDELEAGLDRVRDELAAARGLTRPHRQES